MYLFLTTIQQLATKDSKISYSQQKTNNSCRRRIQRLEFTVNYTQSDVQGYTMKDFKKFVLKFLKQQEKQWQEDLKQEKQRQEDLKQQEKQRQEDSIQQVKQRQNDLKRLHESIERQKERFGKLLESLTKENEPGNLNMFLQKSIINSVGEFINKPEGEVTFKAYFRRYDSIFEKDCEKLPDEKKVRLLLGRFGAAEHKKYVNSFLSRQPGEVTFWETIQILTKIFGEQISLFNTRWQCLNFTKQYS